MAIDIVTPKRKNDDGVYEVELRIANGDLEALESIQQDYDVKDLESIIAFSINVLKQAGGRPIAVTTDDRLTKKLMPADEIRNDRAHK